MDWYVIRTEWWCLLIPASFSSYYKSFMTHHLVVIQECFKLTNGLPTNSIGHQCVKRFTNTFLHVTSINELNQKHFFQLDFSNHCPFHVMFGLTSPWISLRSFYNPTASLIIVDRLSKYAHFLVLIHPYTAKMVVEKFVEGVVKLCGMLK